MYISIKMYIPVVHIIVAWTRMVTIEISGERFMDLRYILDGATKELTEKQMV